MGFWFTWLYLQNVNYIIEKSSLCELIMLLSNKAITWLLLYLADMKGCLKGCQVCAVKHVICSSTDLGSGWVSFGRPCLTDIYLLLKCCFVVSHYILIGGLLVMHNIIIRRDPDLKWIYILMRLLKRRPRQITICIDLTLFHVQLSIYIPFISSQYIVAVLFVL